MVLEPSDVLVHLSLTADPRAADPRVLPVGDGARVLRACGGEPATLDQLASRAGLTPSAVVASVRELERAGWMERARGLCWPR